jgi:hypothetical protein
MDKVLLITFSTTHSTIKAKRLLKGKYNVDIIPAPDLLGEHGCQIALIVYNPPPEEEILSILQKKNLETKQLLETDNFKNSDFDSLELF